MQLLKTWKKRIANVKLSEELITEIVFDRISNISLDL